MKAMNPPLARRRPGSAFTLIEVMIVVAIIGIIVGIAAPAWIRARSQSRMKTCQENLQKIDQSKEQWALANNKKPGSTPAQSDLVDPGAGTGYLKSFPTEPSGGNYVIKPVGEDSECDTTFPGHSLAEVGLVITDIEPSS